LTSFFVSKNNTLQSIVVRFAGDSGDGIQLLGSQFAVSTALARRDFATFPDYPAEIRAPTGTTFGVSAYQINLGGDPITTGEPADAEAWLTHHRQQRQFYAEKSDEGRLFGGPARWQRTG
jgi:hypothetical protein